MSDGPRTVTFTLTEVSTMTGVGHATLLVFVEREWIRPLSEDRFDREDVARIHLISELRGNFGVNDEAVPLILHLLDQLYHLRHEIRKFEAEE